MAAFLGLAAEDLGDDAFHLAAIALVDQPRAPGHQGVVGHDQACQPGNASPHQLALGNGRTVGLAEPGPRQHAGQHQAHRSSGRGTQGNTAEVQSVVGDRQPIAAHRLQQVGRRHAEIAEDDPLVVGMLEGVESVFLQLEVVVLMLRQFHHQHRRAILDERDQADGAAWHDVGDETASRH